MNPYAATDGNPGARGGDQASLSWRLSSGALLLALNFLAGNIGNLSPQLRTVLACAAWLPLLFGMVGPPFLRASVRRKCAALLLLVPVVLGFHAGGVHGIFGLLLTLLIFPVLEGESVLNEQRLQVLFLTTAGSGLWVLARQVFPGAFLVEHHVSTVASHLSSWLCGQSIDFGPTYSGVSIVLLFLLFHLSAFLLSGPRNLRLLAGVLAGQLILLLGYQLCFHLLLAKWRLDSPWVLLGAAQLGLFVLGFGLVLLQSRGLTLQPASWCVRAWPFLPLGAGAFLLMLCTLDAHLFLQKARPPTVRLYDDGTLDWSVPVYGRYSGARGGMFGSLATFLQRHGCEAARGPLTNGWQDRTDVLVVFNLMHKFSPAEKRQIWEFVGRGGSLLAVGDHTGTTAIREPFNDLLEPVNVQFNFDSAMPILRRWIGGMRWFPHYATAGLESEADTQINVGASLSLRPPARPLVVGTHGFSDKGDLTNRASGYLGDRRFSPDERLGDVILVATANYKAGKVMVFGDTTTFQNGALARGGDFAEAIFRSFVTSRSRLVSLLSALGLGTVILSSVWLLARRQTSLPAFALALFVTLYLGDAASRLVGRINIRRAPYSQAGDALIDLSHLSRCDPDLWQSDGLGGLVQNLMRKDYLPSVAVHFSPGMIRRSKLVFLVAPAREFGPAELSVYDEFVRDGGQLFICVGYEESSGCETLLRRFGFRLRNLPLGLVAPASNDAKIYFLGAWPVVAPTDEAEVLCRRGDYPLIVARHYGRGKVVLIGDSGFFLNRNLELPESFNLDNIEFFRKLVPAHER